MVLPLSSTSGSDLLYGLQSASLNAKVSGISTNGNDSNSAYYAKKGEPMYIEEMDADDFKGITAIAPFLSEETLDQIADRAIENNKVSELSSLACFLGNGTLKKIANHLVYSGDSKSLSEFAIFL